MNSVCEGVSLSSQVPVDDFVVDGFRVSDFWMPILWIEGEIARFALQDVESVAQQPQQRLKGRRTQKSQLITSDFLTS